MRFVILVLSFLIMHANSAWAKEVLAGVNYQQHTSESQQITHVLLIDPKKVILKSKHANDTVQGLETVAALGSKANAIAGINGGFFRMGEKQDGLPAGILKIDGRWFGLAYGTRAAIGWSSKSDNPEENIVLMDRVQTKTQLEINGILFAVQGLNQMGSSNKTVLYTDAYGSHTDSMLGGVDVIIQNDQIHAIVPAGKTAIPAGGYVYAIGPKVKRPANMPSVGSSAKVQIKVVPLLKKENSEAWQKVENIVGGIPLLIEGGRVLQDYPNERLKTPFAVKQHARTAIGILPSGLWALVVVEKNQTTGSPGMNLLELSRFLQKLGCVLALNLDGGGSSTFYLQGKVINNPENELDDNIILPIARPIADAILVVPKEQK